MMYHTRYYELNVVIIVFFIFRVSKDFLVHLAKMALLDLS